MRLRFIAVSRSSTVTLAVLPKLTALFARIAERGQASLRDIAGTLYLWWRSFAVWLIERLARTLPQDQPLADQLDVPMRQVTGVLKKPLNGKAVGSEVSYSARDFARLEKVGAVERKRPKRTRRKKAGTAADDGRTDF